MQLSKISGPNQILCLLTLLKIAQENYQFIQKTLRLTIRGKDRIILWFTKPNISVAPTDFETVRLPLFPDVYMVETQVME